MADRCGKKLPLAFVQPVDFEKKELYYLYTLFI